MLIASFDSTYLPNDASFILYIFGCWQVAKRYVEAALSYSKNITIGGGCQGPMDHLLKLKSTVQRRPFDPSDLFLYAVTDSRMNKKWGRSIVDAVKAAIEGGATIIQLRFGASLKLVHFLSVSDSSF